MMTGRDYLGEFEHVVLLAITRLGSGAYGGSIHDEILERTGRDVSIPAVYVTLKRMEKKGLLRSFAGNASESARETRNYALTEEGTEALARSREMLESLWNDAPVSETGSAS